MLGNQEGSLPGSKKMMALRQAYSLSSIWMSRKGFTNSSKILVATRAISSSGQCIGMMKSFPEETREIHFHIFALALQTQSHPEVTAGNVAIVPVPMCRRFPVCSFILRFTSEKQAMNLILWSLFISFAHVMHPHCTQSLLHVLLWFTFCYT